MVKYRITSLLLMADGETLLKAVFPAWNGEAAWFDQSQITVTFATPQTPVDLGPLVKVEIISE
ncbi:hypothetical protein UFOVP291_46 [uncultured Caudovirales phage]|uniref:Uncharacterized protein n=1 Tax=uncultured Caudovirales phage TaxID=2100421 RepID=A0A6J5LLZ0_9CAUD|nr:hypothetical protein UFOVP291_46 [uncultured Caudovirales phage]